MIWIDASFAIEWLQGTKKVKSVSLRKLVGQFGILSAQYIETLVYFEKRSMDSTEYSEIIKQLTAFTIYHPKVSELHYTSTLYLKARQQSSKASLADALLAAVTTLRKDTLLAFDNDFQDLGLRKISSGRWIS